MAILTLSDIDMNNASKILNLPDPSTPQGAATKNYTDIAIANAVSLLAWKDSVRAASIGGNITLTAPGTTLDGVTLAINDRFLAKDQTLPSENGIYVFNGAAVTATRAADFLSTSALEGARVPVEKGTTNSGTLWVLTTQAPTIGSALSFSNQNAAAPAATTVADGLPRLATQSQTDSGASSPANLVVTPAGLLAFAGGKKKFVATIGDGATTAITVTHGFGTTDIQTAVYRVSDGQQVVVDTRYSSTTTATFTFASAPATSTLRVVILA